MIIRGIKRKEEDERRELPHCPLDIYPNGHTSPKYDNGSWVAN